MSMSQTAHFNHWWSTNGSRYGGARTYGASSAAFAAGHMAGYDDGLDASSEVPGQSPTTPLMANEVPGPTPGAVPLGPDAEPTTPNETD